jgi:hypothetical protein
MASLDERWTPLVSGPIRMPTVVGVAESSVTLHKNVSTEDRPLSAL